VEEAPGEGPLKLRSSEGLEGCIQARGIDFTWSDEHSVTLSELRSSGEAVLAKGLVRAFLEVMQAKRIGSE
jgi:hypothetical protein